jgi:hypothetical protein
VPAVGCDQRAMSISMFDLDVDVDVDVERRLDARCLF